MLGAKRFADRPASLDEILEGEDPDGLLENVRFEDKSASSPTDVLAGQFEEINAFIDAHGHAPEKKSGDERRLALYLQAIRDDAEAVARLVEADRYGLLGEQRQPNGGAEPFAAEAVVNEASASYLPPEEVISLDDILASDEDGLLDVADEEVDLYDIKHVPGRGDRAKGSPDEIAERKPCSDFYRFEPLFESIREKLKAGQAESMRFTNETQIEEGDFFVLQGVMCLVDQIGERGRDPNDRNDARLRVIYDNGTESNLLLRSLARALYKDPGGKRIIDPDAVTERMNGLTHRDQPTGTIYVLRSLREDPVIRHARDLYKIGLTAKSVEDRIRGAEKQTTYLEGPVEVVKIMKAYNLNLQRFEGLLHDFFRPRRANFLLTDSQGKQYRPREWFHVPLQSIVKVAELIISGEINRYRLDTISGEVVAKGVKRERGDEGI